MASQAEMVAASQQRQMIPPDWILAFSDWTNESLLSLSKDAAVSSRPRAFAGWEFDYRVAFDILVEDPPIPERKKKKKEPR